MGAGSSRVQLCLKSSAPVTIATFRERVGLVSDSSGLAGDDMTRESIICNGSFGVEESLIMIGLTV